MLYLEDYVEIIEHLPQELRDRFTELREMDLQVQNSTDGLKDRTRLLFNNARRMKQQERDYEFEKIREGFYKTLEDAEEKVTIATQTYELVERYLRRLDQELAKFKMELEADNSGITELLEKRSLELDNPPPTNNSVMSSYPRGEKRKHGQHSISISYTPDKLGAEKAVLSSIVVSEAMRESLSANRLALPGHSPSSSSTSSSSSNSSAHERTLVLTPQTKSTYAGTNALAAAASQAIAATQQSLKRGTSQSQSNLVQQGRRTASLKASYEAINSGQNLNKELTLGSREMINSMSAPSVASNVSVTSEPKKMNKKARTSLVVQPIPEPSPLLEDSEDSSVLDETMFLDNYDPNEPRYCVCNQISYGDMVACDHKDCPFEWFHYPCVGITQPPKGKWFCPQCAASMKRRNRKEK